MIRRSIFLAALAACLSCSQIMKSDAEITIDANVKTSTDYIGNGVQWDPYILDYGTGQVEISEEDWQKIYNRLDYMRPGFIRMVLNTRDVTIDGKYNPEAGLDHITHLLDYCQAKRITVMFGDWGWGLVDAKEGTLNKELLRHAAEYADFLINQKGYSCIKYYNLINEPNGYWASTECSYELWAEAVKYFWEQIEDLGLDDQIKMAAPDVAIWSAEETWWIDNSIRDFGPNVGVYDIHTYPSKCTVNSGEYGEIIKAYKERVPSGMPIVMGEIGLKFVEEADSAYLAENNRRIAKLPHASRTDSQMFVYEHIYGTDMADAVFQTANAGYSGCIAWMLDDAMHTNEAPDKLKIWGFWNIFGEEMFGAEHEAVRPWFYAWSLLCRYIPAGSDIYSVSVSGKEGIKALASIHEGAKTFAVVNVSKEPATVSVASKGFGAMSKAQKYIYGDGLYKTEGDHTMLPAELDVNLNLDKGETFEIPAECMILWTEK